MYVNSSETRPVWKKYFAIADLRFLHFAGSIKTLKLVMFLFCTDLTVVKLAASHSVRNGL